jgi:hypothetical protein
MLRQVELLAAAEQSEIISQTVFFLEDLGKKIKYLCFCVEFILIYESSILCHIKYSWDPSIEDDTPFLLYLETKKRIESLD